VADVEYGGLCGNVGPTEKLTNESIIKYDLIHVDKLIESVCKEAT
jgi:hypothetical protein